MSKITENKRLVIAGSLVYIESIVGKKTYQGKTEFFDGFTQGQMAEKLRSGGNERAIEENLQEQSIFDKA